MRFYIFFLFIFLIGCKTPEARKPVKSASSTFINESVERNKKLIAQEEAFIENIIKKDSLKTYIASESGFWYYYNIKDTATNAYLPKTGDLVNFTFDIKSIDGTTTILSENDNGLQEYLVDQSNQELISGIRDGIKLMKEGEKVTFFFPSHKAYGYYGLENKIGTNIPIQSTITLKSISTSQNN